MEGWPRGLRHRTANAAGLTAPESSNLSPSTNYFLNMPYTNSKMNEYLKQRYFSLKMKAFGLLGNKCANCNAEKDLQIDHIDYKLKKFNITPSLRSKPWEDVLIELKKCQLLCRKCHKIKTVLEGSYGFERAIGSANGQSKLTEQDVILIKDLLTKKLSCESIAKKFGVSRETISAIKTGRSWSHLNCGLEA